MAGKKDKIKDSERFSILVPSLDRCYICGTSDNVEIHEVIHGTSARKKSKEDGLCVGLCKYCHTGPAGVHNVPKIDEYLKREAQIKWMDYYCDKGMNEEEKIRAFIKRYGRSYI